MWCGIVINYIV